MNNNQIPIGELARRNGIAASALRFYEDQGLLSSQRNESGRRQFSRSDLRRVAFIRAAQAVGLTLDQIRNALASLPDRRAPTQKDWVRLSTAWRPLLDQRITDLKRLRDQLSSCIGCGCLSLTHCALYNPGDVAVGRGAGARYLLGDQPPMAYSASSERKCAVRKVCLQAERSDLYGKTKLVVTIAPAINLPSAASLSANPVKLAHMVYLPAAAVSGVNTKGVGATA